MKEGIKLFLVYSLIIYFVLSLFKEGIQLPDDNITYLILTIFVLSLTVMMSCPLLSFLTIKCKLPTFFLMTTILLTGILYVLKIFMVDFYVNEFVFNGLELGSIQVKSFEVVPLLSIVISAVVCSFFCTIYRELDTE